MIIQRNSVKCTYCGEEVESTHRHDFKVHYCEKHPAYAKEWKGDVIIEKMPREVTFNFAVDGGRAYLRRVGGGFIETSIYADE